MRYWICILVLALAVSAMGDTGPAPTCPDKSLYVDSDGDLPDSTDWYSVEDCFNIEWTLKFIRNPYWTGRTIFYPYIDSTNVRVMVDSDDYSSPGAVTILGFGRSFGDHNRLRIELDSEYATLGHFRKIHFRAQYYR